MAEITGLVVSTSREMVAVTVATASGRYKLKVGDEWPNDYWQQKYKEIETKYNELKDWKPDQCAVRCCQNAPTEERATGDKSPKLRLCLVHAGWFDANFFPAAGYDFLTRILQHDGYRLQFTGIGRVSGVDSPFTCEELGGINRKLEELKRLKEKPDKEPLWTNTLQLGSDLQKVWNRLMDLIGSVAMHAAELSRHTERGTCTSQKGCGPLVDKFENIARVTEASKGEKPPRQESHGS